jgi:hypothetical protein
LFEFHAHIVSHFSCFCAAHIRAWVFPGSPAGGAAITKTLNLGCWSEPPVRQCHLPARACAHGESAARTYPWPPAGC